MNLVRQARRRAAAVAALLAAGGALVWAAPTGSPAARPAGSNVGVDAQLATLAAVGGWLVLGWLLIAATLSAVAGLPGTVGRAADAIAARVAPVAVRRIVEAALGVAVTATLAVPTAALAGPHPQRRRLATHAAAAAPGELGDRVYAVDLSEGGQPEPDVPFDRPAAGGAQPAAPAPAPIPPPESVPPPRKSAAPLRVVQGALREERADALVVVRTGDSLWAIAGRELGPRATAAAIESRWRQWYAANRAVVGADPDLIRPGARLVPPAAGSTE